MSVVPHLPVLLAYTPATLLLAATPGPDMALFLSRTLQGGRRDGLAALSGATVGILIHTGAAAFGLSALLAASPNAYGAVRVAGALYLLWLAYGALRHGAALRLDGGEGAAGGFRDSFATGLLINLTNPKVILFFVTFLPQFVDAGDADASGKFAFLGLYSIVLGGMLNAGIILMAARVAASVRARPRALRMFDFGFAGLMAAFSARLLWAAGR